MARDGSGVYSLPAGSTAVSGATIIPSVHNTPLADIAADLNVARPVVAGGTGATTASGARTNLGLGTMATQAASAVAITGGTVEGITTLGATGGTLDGVAIGGSTPAAGAFTTLASSGLATLATVDINGGAVDGAAIGANSASTGAFTTLGASGAVTFATTLTVGGELTATGGVKFASGVYIDNSGSGLSYYTNGGDHVWNTSGGGSLTLAHAGLLTHYYPVATGSTSIANFKSDQPGANTTVITFKANGDINNQTGAYGTISDARIKENIVDATSQWEDVKAMQFRHYNLIGSDLTQLGVVAQELQAAGMGGLVSTDEDEDGTLSVKTTVLLMKCAKAVQEAILRIEALEQV